MAAEVERYDGTVAQLHGRRHAGAVRRPGGPRGRPRAGGARAALAIQRRRRRLRARRARGLRDRARAAPVASTPARWSSRPTSGRPPALQRARRHRQRRRPAAGPGRPRARSWSARHRAVQVRGLPRARGARRASCAARAAAGRPRTGVVGERERGAPSPPTGRWSGATTSSRVLRARVDGLAEGIGVIVAAHRRAGHRQDAPGRRGRRAPRTATACACSRAAASPTPRDFPYRPIRELLRDWLGVSAPRPARRASGSTCKAAARRRSTAARRRAATRSWPPARPHARARRRRRACASLSREAVHRSNLEVVCRAPARARRGAAAAGRASRTCTGPTS